MIFFVHDKFHFLIHCSQLAVQLLRYILALGSQLGDTLVALFYSQLLIGL